MGVGIGRMARWKITGAAGVTWAMVAFGCGGGGGGGSCTPSTDLSGNWSGPTSGDTIARGNPGIVKATFVQIGCDLTGEWTFDYQDSHLDVTRAVGGTAPESSTVDFQFGSTVASCDVTLQFCQTVAGCIYDVKGSLVSPTRIVGTYETGQNCSQAQSGSFDIQFVSPLAAPPQ